MAIAEDALQNLPEGWELAVAEEGENKGIPRFINLHTGETHGNHPDEERIKKMFETERRGTGPLEQARNDQFLGIVDFVDADKDSGVGMMKAPDFFLDDDMDATTTQNDGESNSSETKNEPTASSTENGGTFEKELFEKQQLIDEYEKKLLISEETIHNFLQEKADLQKG